MQTRVYFLFLTCLLELLIKSGVYIVFSFNNIGIFLYRQIERNRVFGEYESAIRIDENDALPW